MGKEDQKTTGTENTEIKAGNEAGETMPDVLDPKPEKTSKVHVLVGIEFTLLKVKFTAGFEKGDLGYQILLLPTDQTQNNGMSIREMIKEVQVLMNKGGAEIEGGAERMEEDLTSAINGVNDPDAKKGEEKTGVDPLDLRVYLRQAFLHYEKSGDKKTFEYAFQLEINAEDMMPDIGLVKLDRLSVSVWSTERKKILESMGMFHIDEILKEYA